MSLQKLIGCSAARCRRRHVRLDSSHASAMYPIAHFATPYVSTSIARGFRLGPIGTCILGTDDPRPVVVEHPTTIGVRNQVCHQAGFDGQ